MKITLSTGRVIDTKEGESILESLKQAGVFLTSSCGGKGVCGKCKIVVQSGDVDAKSHIKLSSEEIQKGFAIACMTAPLGDIIVDIPKQSILTVEGQIVTGRSKDLLALMHSTGEDIDPLSERIVMKLPEPSLDDNISDLERLKRELLANGLGCLRVPSRFMSNLARTVRQENWEITLSAIHSEDCYEITNIFPGNRKVPQYGIAVDIGTTTIVVYLVDLTDGQLVDVASIYNSQIRFGDDVITRIVNATEHDEMENLHKAVISDINDLITILVSSHKIDVESIDTIVVAGNTTMTHFFLELDPQAIREEPYIPTANVFPLSHAGELGINVNRKVPVYSFPCVASYVGGDIVAGVLATRMHKTTDLSIFIDIGTNGEIVIGNFEWLMAAACSAGPCFEGSGIKHGMRATEGAIEDVKIDPGTLEVEIEVIGDNARPMGICGSGMIDAIADMFLAGILNQKGKLQKGVSDRVREGEDGPEFVIHYGKNKDIVLTDMGNTSITGTYLCILSRKLRSEAENISKGMTYVELSVKSSFMDEYVSGMFIPHTNIDAFPSVKKLLKS
jgi:uncharacterized 2Fe-2S/4Fe-4S cluster protein (DUF4445 family)